MVGINSLKAPRANKTSRKVGRGGKRGKTSGRGHKGQMQHGGHGVRPEMRDIIKKLPKRRGFGKNRARTVNDARVVYMPVNFAALDVFKSGDTVSPKTLVQHGVASMNKGRLPHVKILAKGDLKTKLTFTNCTMSQSARAAVEKAGGKIE